MELFWALCRGGVGIVGVTWFARQKPLPRSCWMGWPSHYRPSGKRPKISPAFPVLLGMNRLPATILDGKAIATRIEAELAEQVAEFIQNNGHEPTLAAVLVGDDPASAIYVKNKRAACERVGIESRLSRLSPSTTEEELLELIAELNNDDDVHGILVQLPLPTQIREQKVLDAVHPLKDVDCFHPENVGLLVQGRPRYIPCTPHGCIQILHRSGIAVSGKHAVVVGRSEIVGKPVATLLAAKESHLGATACNATVTLCHSRTKELADICRQADI